MASNTLLHIFFFFFFSFFCLGLKAQSASDGKLTSSEGVIYKRVSRDSVRVPVKEKTRASAKSKVRRSLVRTGKSASSAVDSVRRSPKLYYLGERVIMPGDSGRDVKSVAKILVNKLYMDESLVIYTVDGGVLYDGELIRAVKHFQEFNGMYPDGIVGKETIKALRKRKN